MHSFCGPADKKTAVGVVEGNLDEAGELVRLASAMCRSQVMTYGDTVGADGS